MKVFIIHGSFGSHLENWQPWLKRKLEEEGQKVIAEDFPNPPHQSLDSWMQVIERHKIDPDDILVGHSLGVAFILNLLEKYKVKAAFLVAGFIGRLGNEKFDPVNKTFAEKTFDWEKIKNNCEKFYLYHSYNDTYVPLSKAKELSELIGQRITMIPGAGHFSEGDGFFSFPQLLRDIKKITPENNN